MQPEPGVNQQQFRRRFLLFQLREQLLRAFDPIDDHQTVRPYLMLLADQFGELRDVAFFGFAA